MPTIITAGDARAYIREAVEIIGRDAVLKHVAAWSETTENDLSPEGNVWVKNPQPGHWLNVDQMIELTSFMVALEATKP